MHNIGHYSRSGRNYFSLLMTVEPGNRNLPDHVNGSITNPRKWWRIIQGSCDQFIFAEYMDYVCHSIEESLLPNNFDSQKYFMWDNLSVHQTDLVLSTVELCPTRYDYQFCVVCCPPYCPKMAPIEYIFNEIGTILKRDVCSD